MSLLRASYIFPAQQFSQKHKHELNQLVTFSSFQNFPFRFSRNILKYMDNSKSVAGNT